MLGTVQQKLIIHQIATSISTFDCINFNDNRINDWIYERSHISLAWFAEPRKRYGRNVEWAWFLSFFGLWNANTIFISYFITEPNYMRTEYISRKFFFSRHEAGKQNIPSCSVFVSQHNEWRSRHSVLMNASQVVEACSSGDSFESVNYAIELWK